MSRDRVLSALRGQFASAGVNAYFIPSCDAHSSEYCPDFVNRVSASSNFTGSSANIFVLEKEALLWTDSRYWLQAENELSKSWTLMKSSAPGVPCKKLEWLKTLSKGTKIGYDPQLMSETLLQQYQKSLDFVEDSALVPIERNLVDMVWGDSRPSPSSKPVMIHPTKYSGMSASDKVQFVQEHMEKNNAALAIFSQLDEIAYLLNLRGGDTKFTPIFTAYCVVSKKSNSSGKNVFLFTDAEFEPAARQETLKLCEIRPYLDITKGIEELTESVETGFKRFLHSEQTSVAILSAIKKSDCVPTKEELSCIMKKKIIKNEVERQGFIDCHKRDGLALTQFLKWIEEGVASGKAITELEASDKLATFRSAQPLFHSLSFETISGYKENAAIIHYRPTEKNSKVLGRDGTYLLDSGGQYLDGTTDVTRTTHFGNPTEREIESYTLVLKANLNVQHSIFPHNTRGCYLEGICRQSLWNYGLNYGHGTSHGVGHFLGVHDGPCGIGSLKAVLNEGSVVSNEPGFYVDGEFGIRIENLELVVPVKTKYQFNGVQYFTFQTLTMVPLEKKLIDISLLTSTEVDWINSYHATVLKELLALSSDPIFDDWLKNKCSPLVTEETKRRKID